MESQFALIAGRLKLADISLVFVKLIPEPFWVFSFCLPNVLILLVTKPSLIFLFSNNFPTCMVRMKVQFTILRKSLRSRRLEMFRLPTQNQISSKQPKK